MGSRPRPANTAHCQKSGILELKGQKSKVFAALSLPEMWLYKSEQVCGQRKPPHGMRGMEGAKPGLVPKAEQRGNVWAGKGEWQSWKLEILPRAAVMGTRSGSAPQSSHYPQIIIISTRQFGPGHTEHPNPSQDSWTNGHRISSKHTCCKGDLQ